MPPKRVQSGKDQQKTLETYPRVLSRYQLRSYKNLHQEELDPAFVSNLPGFSSEGSLVDLEVNKVVGQEDKDSIVGTHKVDRKGEMLETQEEPQSPAGPSIPVVERSYHSRGLDYKTILQLSQALSPFTGVKEQP